MAKISQLYNEKDEKIYPITSSDYVINPTTGTSISKQIEVNNNEIELLKQSLLPTNNVVSIALNKDDWDAVSKTQTVSVVGILSEESYQIIQIAPSTISTNNIRAYKEAGILGTSQATNQITFSANIIPTQDIIVLISYLYTQQYMDNLKTVTTTK